MRIKTIIAVAAIAMATTIGLASAADQFSTLEGIPAVAMSSVELDAVVGGRFDSPPVLVLTPRANAAGGTVPIPIFPNDQAFAEGDGLPGLLVADFGGFFGFGAGFVIDVQ